MAHELAVTRKHEEESADAAALRANESPADKVKRQKKQRNSRTGAADRVTVTQKQEISALIIASSEQLTLSPEDLRKLIDVSAKCKRKKD